MNFLCSPYAIGLLSACPVCPVCDVGVLWPNGWMDQGETWHGGRPRPRPYCVRWGNRGPSSPKEALPPNFWPVSIVARRSPISATAEHLSNKLDYKLHTFYWYL